MCLNLIYTQQSKAMIRLTLPSECWYANKWVMSQIQEIRETMNHQLAMDWCALLYHMLARLKSGKRFLGSVSGS